jgi:hypothetical protein
LINCDKKRTGRVRKFPRSTRNRISCDSEGVPGVATLTRRDPERLSGVRKGIREAPEEVSSVPKRAPRRGVFAPRRKQLPRVDTTPSSGVAKSLHSHVLALQSAAKRVRDTRKGFTHHGQRRRWTGREHRVCVKSLAALGRNSQRLGISSRRFAVGAVFRS